MGRCPCPRAPLKGVRDGADGVDGQLVAELPLPGEARQLVGLTCSPVVVVAATRGIHPLEDALEGGLAEPSDGSGGQAQAVVAS